MFTPRLCGVAQLVEINKFDQSTLKWQTDVFFTPDIINFYGCQVNFGVRSDSLPETDYYEPNGEHKHAQDVYLRFSSNGVAKYIPPVSIYTDKFLINNDNKTYRVDGVLIKMIEAIETNLNFTKAFNPVSVDTDLPQKSWLVDYTLDVEICTHSLAAQVFTTVAIFNDFYSLIVPPGQKYSPLEKLILPFDSAVWVCFAIVFITAYFVVVFIKQFSDREVAEIIIGDHVSGPGLNIFMIFMGGGMRVLPKKNFPRFLVTSFILFCLIMRFGNFSFLRIKINLPSCRTAYQGKYFEYLTSDIRKQEVQSVEEIIEKKLIIFSKRCVGNQEKLFNTSELIVELGIFER